MATQRFYTVPHGKSAFILQLCGVSFLLLLSVFCFAFGMPGAACACLVLVLVLGVLICFSVTRNYLNVICFTDGEVMHGGELYAWDRVCVTIVCKPAEHARGFAYYAYFAERYLSNEETHSANERKRGFYMLLTPQRAELLCRYCPHVIPLPADGCQNRVFRVIRAHNAQKVSDGASEQ